MLSDQLSQLLTAYVDGELTNRQRKAIARLLHRSAEARALLRKLQEDAARLRSLPRPHLGAEFTARVLSSLRQRQAQERREAARASVFPAWAGLAAAAGILLAVGLGSFFYFSQPSNEPAAGGLVAAADTSKGEPTPQPAPEKNGKGDPATVVVQGEPKRPESPPPERLGPPDQLADAGPPKDPIKPDGPGSETVIGKDIPQPDMEMFKPTVVKPLFSLIVPVREIQAEQLRKSIAAETALRIELPCGDTAKGFRRLQSALKEVGITLVIDQAAQNRLSKPRLRSNYVIILEDLTAQDLARVLARLGSDDKKAAAAKPRPDGQFDKMVLNRLSDDDRKELAAVLHVDPRLLQGGPTEKYPKASEWLALAVTYNPERPRANSPEVKRYLDNRKPLGASSLQVLLVLRETPG